MDIRVPLHSECCPGMCVEDHDQCPYNPPDRIWECPECGLQTQVFDHLSRMVHVACPISKCHAEMHRVGILKL